MGFLVKLDLQVVSRFGFRVHTEETKGEKLYVAPFTQSS